MGLEGGRGIAAETVLRQIYANCCLSAQKNGFAEAKPLVNRWCGRKDLNLHGA
jgi:hypothetical protein